MNIFRLLSVLFCVVILLRAEEIRPGGDPDAFDLFLILEHVSEANENLSAIGLARPIENNDTEMTADMLLNQSVESKLDKLEEAVLLLKAKKLSVEHDSQVFIREKNRLDNRIRVNRQRNNTVAVLRDRANLEYLQLKGRVSAFLSRMYVLIGKESNRQALEEIIESELKTVKAKDFSEFDAAMNKGGEGKVFENFSNNYQLLSGAHRSYVEWLEYLQDTSGSLVYKNVLLSTLNVQESIRWLDGLIPYTIFGFSSGRLILSLLSMLFFISFRRFVVNGIARTVDAYMLKGESGEAHAFIVESLRVPIGIFIALYGAQVALDILFYPAEFTDLWATQLFGAAYVGVIAWIVIKLATGYGEYLAGNLITRKKDALRKEVVNLLLKGVYFAVMVFALIMILSIFGFDVSALVASLGIGGLAVALAAKDTLSNLFSSIFILVDNSFSQGDWIQIGDVEGTVVEIGLRQTTIRTFDNALLFVPNSKLSNDSIRNWNRRRLGRRIKMHIGLTYETKAEQLEACVEEIRTMLQEHPGISTPREQIQRENSAGLSRYRKEMISQNDLSGYKNTLLVFADQFGPSSIDILVYCFTRTIVWEEWFSIKQDVMLKIMTIVENNGLSFAFPSQSVYVESWPEKMEPEKSE